MSKLINLQILEAKDVICGSVVSPADKTEDNDFWDDIQKDTAKRDYTVPSHIIVGVFDDGSTKVAGIESLNVLNHNIDADNLERSYSYGIFYYNTIIDRVGINEAKAFVRYELNGHDDIKEEIICDAKRTIYEDLLKSGVIIEEEARYYLLT